MCEAMNPIDADVVQTFPEAPSRPLPELLLLRETHHRLMNSFAMVAACLRLESKAGSGSLPPEAVARLAEMICAQGELHRRLALRQTNELIPLDEHMTELCRSLSDAVLRPLGVACEVVTDAGHLPAWQCESLGLATTELVMNAAKHAFHGRPGGMISIELRCQGDHWRCVVADNGKGFDSRAGRTAGDALQHGSQAGLHIIDGLIGSLDGRRFIHSTPAGTIVVMTFPNTGFRPSGRGG